MSSDYDRYVTVRLDTSHVEHLLGEDCKAGVMKPCGFSEGVMARVHDAVRQPPASDAGLRAALRKLATELRADSHLVHDKAMGHGMRSVADRIEAALSAPAAVCETSPVGKHAFTRGSIGGKQCFYCFKPEAAGGDDD